MSKTQSAEDYRLLNNYEDARQVLLQEEFADRLEKPLGYWALQFQSRLVGLALVSPSFA